MVEFCRYSSCHNLGSSTFQGYCNKDHQEKGGEYELLMKIVEKIPTISTIREAREFLKTYLQKKRSNNL